MTTDLTDGSELSEEEFDWDVFLPDPDDAEIAAEAGEVGVELRRGVEGERRLPEPGRVRSPDQVRPRRL